MNDMKHLYKTTQIVPHKIYLHIIVQNEQHLHHKNH